MDSQVLCSIEQQQRADRGDVARQTAQALLCLILRSLFIAHTYWEIHQLFLKLRQTDVEWDEDTSHVTSILNNANHKCHTSACTDVRAQATQYQIMVGDIAAGGVLNNTWLHQRKLPAVFSFVSFSDTQPKNITLANASRHSRKCAGLRRRGKEDCGVHY